MNEKNGYVVKRERELQPYYNDDWGTWVEHKRQATLYLKLDNARKVAKEVGGLATHLSIA